MTCGNNPCTSNDFITKTKFKNNDCSGGIETKMYFLPVDCVGDSATTSLKATCVSGKIQLSTYAASKDCLTTAKTATVTPDTCDTTTGIKYDGCETTTTTTTSTTTTTTTKSTDNTTTFTLFGTIITVFITSLF